MNSIRDCFVCDVCDNKDLILVYNFSLRFHKVNFSDELIYDQLTDELYQCTKCQKRFTKKEIQEGLALLRKKRKGAMQDEGE